MTIDNTNFKYITIQGGITAAKGFRANGIHCGIRKNKEKNDLALVVSDNICASASVYTTNLVKGAPIYVTKKNISDGKAQAIICNSGNANTCTDNGIEIAQGMCDEVSKHLGIPSTDVIVASTGVIGQRLSLQPIKNGMQQLTQGLCYNKGELAANAIMTTDTTMKQAAISFELKGKTCVIGGMAKGSGMIHPNMATMLAFITTDISISSDLLSDALQADVVDTFNMISVDQDTSTNDMLSILANGQAGNEKITNKNEDYDIFCKALNVITSKLSYMIAQDGEGATKTICCTVVNGDDKQQCRLAAKAVICSNLVKAAMFGEDANWGRILCAIGYSGADVDVDKVDITFVSETGSEMVCKDGKGLDFSEQNAAKILQKNEITILVDLKAGTYKASAYGCDLTYDYVKINGDYRT